MNYAIEKPPQKAYLCIFKDKEHRTARFVNSCLCEQLAKVQSTDDSFSSFSSVMYSPFSHMNMSNLGLVAGYSLDFEEFNEKDDTGERDDTVSTMILRCTIEGITLYDATEMFESIEGKSDDCELIPKEDECFLGMNMCNSKSWYLDVEKLLSLEKLS